MPPGYTPPRQFEGMPDRRRLSLHSSRCFLTSSVTTAELMRGPPLYEKFFGVGREKRRGGFGGGIGAGAGSGIGDVGVEGSDST